MKMTFVDESHFHCQNENENGPTEVISITKMTFQRMKMRIDLLKLISIAEKSFSQTELLEMTFPISEMSFSISEMSFSISR